MDEMKLLCKIKNFDSTIPGNVLLELQMYSTFNVENSIEDGKVTQEFFVPASEMEFYDQWKEKVGSELAQSKKNTVLVQNIARRHGIKLPK